MAWDDPIVWVLIIAVVVFIFGASRIPGLARAFGSAKKEFDTASKSGGANQSTASTSSSSAFPAGPDDPLVQAAQKEGIDTTGKTKEQIASELSWKLSKK